MRWKRISIVIAAIATCPAALVAGGFLADWFYMRFMFHDPISDFGPGDAIGELILAIIFGTTLIAVTLLGWRSVYKRISNLRPL
jgi:hypothetical protein